MSMAGGWSIDIVRTGMRFGGGRWSIAYWATGVEHSVVEVVSRLVVERHRVVSGDERSGLLRLKCFLRRWRALMKSESRVMR